MKKLIPVLLAAIVVLFGCKKSSNTSVHDKLVANWKLHQLTFDVNGNGTLDASDQSITIDSIFIRFKSDGTGYTSTTSNASTATFNWSLASNNYLVITDTAGGNTNSSSLLITSGPGANLTLKDTSNSSVQWDVFIKQ